MNAGRHEVFIHWLLKKINSVKHFFHIIIPIDRLFVDIFKTAKSLVLFFQTKNLKKGRLKIF